MKSIWKKYGKIVAAAVFLTVAGLYYGFVVRRADLIHLGSDGHSMQSVFKEEVSLPDQDIPVTASQTEPAMIYVHICGAVSAPGVYELPEGSRIFEAVEAAGGFTEEAAQYAIDNLEVDWKENALKTAENYQETMAMSPKAIYDQLISEYGEKFTEEEAQYAIDNLE